MLKLVLALHKITLLARVLHMPDCTPDVVSPLWPEILNSRGAGAILRSRGIKRDFTQLGRQGLYATEPFPGRHLCYFFNYPLHSQVPVFNILLKHFNHSKFLFQIFKTY